MRDCVDGQGHDGMRAAPANSLDRAGMLDGKITQQDVRSRGVAFGLCYSEATGGQRNT
jgi:hypothetical protein